MYVLRQGLSTEAGIYKPVYRCQECSLHVSWACGMMLWESPGCGQLVLPGLWGKGLPLPHLDMWTSTHSLEDRVRPTGRLATLLPAIQKESGVQRGPSKQSWAFLSTACPCASG